MLVGQLIAPSFIQSLYILVKDVGTKCWSMLADQYIKDDQHTWLSVSPTLCWSKSLIAEFSSESDVEFSLGIDFSFVSVVRENRNKHLLMQVTFYNDLNSYLGFVKINPSDSICSDLIINMYIAEELYVCLYALISETTGPFCKYIFFVG